MPRFYIIATLALASAAAVSAPAFAGGSDVAFTLPLAFSNDRGHQGLEMLTNDTKTTVKGVAAGETARLPGGWDQGKADWKAAFHDANTTSPTNSTGRGRH